MRDYVCLYHSYLDAIQALSDAERGRLFTAMLEYSITGAAGHLGGNERFLFPMVKAQIDRDRENYETKCRKNRENGKKGANAPERTQPPPNAGERPPNAPQGKGKGKGKGKGEGEDPPLPPLAGVSPELSEAFTAWLDYKRERREGYKPTGLKSLVTQVKKAAGEYGDHAVAELIRECMASNWSGIIFDRLKKGVKRDGAGALQSPGTAQGGAFHGFRARSALDD